MAIYRVQQTLSMVTGVTADEVVNTFHFEGAGIPADVAEIIILMESFYDDLQTIYSADVRQNNHVLKIYDLADPEPRYPISETTYNFNSAPAGLSAPHEIAICASFQADRVSGQPQSRRRGRVYLGPIDNASFVAGGFIDNGIVTNVVGAMNNLYTDSLLTSVVWSVYSPTNGTVSYVTNGWCDNAPDVQRRRGVDPTIRGTW